MYLYFLSKENNARSSRLTVRELHWNGFLVKYFTFKLSSKMPFKCRPSYLFICLVSPFKTRNSWNRETSCLIFFLALSFSCPSINSSTSESRLWKRLVWFQAIFLEKNVPKLLEMCYLSVKRSGEQASNTVLFTSKTNDVANQNADTSVFTDEKIVWPNSWLL